MFWLSAVASLSTILLICAMICVLLAGKQKRTSRKVSVSYFASEWVSLVKDL